MLILRPREARAELVDGLRGGGAEKRRPGVRVGRYES
jgi:hypothetical protein